MKRTFFVTFLTSFLIAPLAAGNVVKVGSKKFTESVILGEMATHLARSAGYDVNHTRELGGTRILWNALLKGDIDVYPEYTGTITHEILAEQNITSEDNLRTALSKHGIRMSKPIGFNNTYAIGVKRELATKLKLNSLSDLARYPALRFGFSSEFMERSDGWPGLKMRYGLPQTSVTGLDHDLAYRGLNAKSLDAIDLYATDAEIRYYDLTILRDDRRYFPDYDAVLLYRENVVEQYPGLDTALLRIEGLIDASSMAALNSRAKFEQVSGAVVAADFLNNRLGLNAVATKRNRWSDLIVYTKAHLALVTISLFFAVLVAIPLGILAAKIKFVGRGILVLVGVVQTIPSLALLVFMIPLLGIGTLPAMVALFLYSLLPIIRNTYQGLSEIPRQLDETAHALGLSSTARLFQIELPMAAGAIFAGIKTAAVINIGTATLGALIGAGGYGQPILRGIRLDNIDLILLGAVPAALMALLAEGIFEVVERVVIPRGLRL